MLNTHTHTHTYIFMQYSLVRSDSGFISKVEYYLKIRCFSKISSDRSI
jgi:hypothetical protein